MLISSIASKVRDQIGDRGGIFAKDQAVISWVNEAVLDIFRKTEIGREALTTFSLTTGNDTITTVGQTLRVHFMHNGEFEMEESTIDEILNHYGVNWLQTPGTPRFFYMGYLAGVSFIQVAPAADKNYTITYSRTAVPTAFTDVADDIGDLLPATFDYDVVRFCVMRAHEMEKDFQAANNAQEQYDRNMWYRADETQKLSDNFSSISADELDFI